MVSEAMVSLSVLDVRQDGSVLGIASRLYMSPRVGELPLGLHTTLPILPPAR